MLVLDRKVGQSIIIGDNIEVIFLRQVCNGKIKLGIEAPKNINIIRDELLIKNNNKEKNHV